jgi:hypothetical protein
MLLIKNLIDLVMCSYDLYLILLLGQVNYEEIKNQPLC